MNIELKNRIYDDSRPNGLIERTFPDSVVPLDLVELLDARILQFPKLINGLVETWIFYIMLIQAFQGTTASTTSAKGGCTQNLYQDSTCG